LLGTGEALLSSGIAGNPPLAKAESKNMRRRLSVVTVRQGSPLEGRLVSDYLASCDRRVRVVDGPNGPD
jgi:hypothetical protein